MELNYTSEFFWNLWVHDTGLRNYGSVHYLHDTYRYALDPVWTKYLCPMKPLKLTVPRPLPWDAIF